MSYNKTINDFQFDVYQDLLTQHQHSTPAKSNQTLGTN